MDTREIFLSHQLNCHSIKRLVAVLGSITSKPSQTLKASKSMLWTLVTNISLASFQLPSLKLLYLDPYNNTFGEKDWIVLFCTAILCILTIILIFSMLGIVMFVKYGISEENPGTKIWLLDELISFAMIISIVMLMPAVILMTYRNIFGPLESVFVTQMLLSVLEV